MKLFTKLLLSAIVLIFSNSIKAQVTTAKQNLFDNYSSAISCPKSELEKIFNSAEGTSIKLSFGNNFQFSGIVTSSVRRYNNLQSVSIKSTTTEGLVLGISKRTNDDLSYSYIGRIINHKYADAFELKSDANGNYYLNKIKTDDLIEDR